MRPAALAGLREWTLAGMEDGEPQAEETRMPQPIRARIHSIINGQAALLLGDQEIPGFTVPAKWLPEGLVVGSVVLVTITCRPDIGKAVWVELTPER